MSQYPSAESFRDDVLHRFYMRMHEMHADNYDEWQTRIVGADRSRVFNLGLHRPYLLFFVEHFSELHEAYERLASEASREMFRELILFHLAGHLHVKLPTNDGRYWELRAQAEDLPWVDSQVSYPVAQFGPLRHYPYVDFAGSTLKVDCWPFNVLATYLQRQYFLDREGCRIMPEPGDVVIDGGACLGDTALAFAMAVGPDGHVFAFEPVLEHLAVAQVNAEQNAEKASNVTFVPTGLGSEDREAPPVSNVRLDPGFGVREKSHAVLQEISVPFPSSRIDTRVDDGEIPRVDFLKLDIEGAELDCLRGAEQTLRRFRPKLAISLYHRFEDFYEIPEYLADLDLGYEFHVDHYTISRAETVLYARAA